MKDRYDIVINGKTIKENLSLEDAMLTMANMKYVIDNFKIVKVIYEDDKNVKKEK